MPKAPAFQFYPADYLKDTRCVSLDARGAWSDCLCLMWFEPERGKITRTLQAFANLWNVTVEKAAELIDELEVNEVCNVERNGKSNASLSVTQASSVRNAVTQRNEKVTLINRRMVKTEKERKGGSSRQSRYRERHKKNASNGEVTEHSSYSFSSSFKEESCRDSSLTNSAELVTPKQTKSVVKKVAEPTSDHSLLMKHHCDRLGRITDGAAQGRAVRSILKHHTSSEAVACYEYQVKELKQNGGWRSKVNWMTVNTDMAEWIQAGKPTEAKRGSSQKYNGNGNSAADRKDQRAIDKHELIESIRARQPGKGLPGSDASGSS